MEERRKEWTEERKKERNERRRKRGKEKKNVLEFERGSRQSPLALSNH